MRRTSLILLLLSLAASAASPPPRYQVVQGWPVLPEGRILGAVTGVAVNSRHEVLVFHRAGGSWNGNTPKAPIKFTTIWIFDGRTGRLVREWGQNLFLVPHGLSVDDHDNVWVTDVELHQVMKFSPAGRLLMTVGVAGVPGDDAQHFNSPSDVAVLPDGSFYVSDGYGNARVMKFSAKGAFQFQWGAKGSRPGQFDLPHGLALDRAGRVYVADRSNSRIQVFDAFGRFLAQWKDPAIGRPFGVAIVGDQAFTVDGGDRPPDGTDRSGATQLDLKGHVRSRFGRFGNYDGQFRRAHDVAVDKDATVYVVDISGQRVQKFTPGPA